jgi:hypothetical protein
MLPVGREYIRVGYYGFGVGSFFSFFFSFSGVGMGRDGWMDAVDGKSRFRGSMVHVFISSVLWYGRFILSGVTVSL